MARFKPLTAKNVIRTACPVATGFASVLTANMSSHMRKLPMYIHRRRGVDRQKLIIILVGLPGRGKTFLCNKLMCYLNWLGAHTAQCLNAVA